ncbi:5'-3' exoribonuclease 2 [Trichoplax sp. H2]|nr:5'-3' exoribonuclease 2 [Trichoplax sp. H2]|eukprot:RDD44675.1 5'-3' exoribonuclease 2 [Trichoplax sp. H2]
MGVPAFFRWLSKKYPSIIAYCYEEKAKNANESDPSVDATGPNPNGVEFDNLYLDMNGIIHPCCHPEDKYLEKKLDLYPIAVNLIGNSPTLLTWEPAPQTEDDMMTAIFDYIDRIFNIVRPRKLIYMAIDGVAPKAKMNQQRSRRFRAAKDTREKVEQVQKIRGDLADKGLLEDEPQISSSTSFDSNCITPGTEFMAKLAKCLRYYVADRLNNNPAWSKIAVILSDANVPGEGEHKIMDFIRSQRENEHYDPNISHCLYGADADLIMLGMATHEPNFTIIREEFVPNAKKPCEICNQYGHSMQECTGKARKKQGSFDELPPPAQEKQFVFVRLSYLERDLRIDGLPFEYDIERVIDDWVFLCFFVGNDFLPHLPSLQIREGAIDRLIGIYKTIIHSAGGYLTENGRVNLRRVQLLMTSLGNVEDEILKRRLQQEAEYKRREKERQNRNKPYQNPRHYQSGPFHPRPVSEFNKDKRNLNSQDGGDRREFIDRRNEGNLSAAQKLRMLLNSDGESSKSDPLPESNSAPINNESGKRTRGESEACADDQSEQASKKLRKAEETGKNDVMDGQKDEKEDEVVDEIRLGEEGWKERYYLNKFQVSTEDEEFRGKVVASYVKGLCWVMLYYYQGCQCWKWYFDYHYAPFASDFINIRDINVDFASIKIPLTPLEQLMSVFPAASKSFLPKSWAKLMFDQDSPIIDFYPEDFKIDLNGKKYAWQGVALLPFVDEVRLKDALKELYGDLTEEEIERNSLGCDYLFVSRDHPLFTYLFSIDTSETEKEPSQLIETSWKQIYGSVKKDNRGINLGSILYSPIPFLKNIENSNAISAKYLPPTFPEDHVYLSRRLANACVPARVLKPPGYDRRGHGRYRPMTGLSRNIPQAQVPVSGQRMIRQNLPRNDSYHPTHQWRPPYSAEESQWTMYEGSYNPYNNEQSAGYANVNWQRPPPQHQNSHNPYHNQHNNPRYSRWDHHDRRGGYGHQRSRDGNYRNNANPRPSRDATYQPPYGHDF